MPTQPQIRLNQPCLSTLRYRAIPTFGTGTIRRFKNNVTETKQLAARDYEDLLQVRVV